MVSFRSANPQEVDQVIELTDYVFRVSGGLEASMGRQFPTFLSPDNAANLYVAVDDDRVIAHVGVKKNTAILYGHKVSMASIGAVCTHPHYRGQGIGTKLLHDVFQSLNKENVGFVTISGTRGLYKRNHCVETGGAATFIFRAGESPVVDNYPKLQNLSVRCVHDTTAMFNIYRREPVRHQRSKWEFPSLLKGATMTTTPNILTSVIAFTGNRGLAYIIGWENKPGVFKVVEYAGERCVIPWLVRQLLKAKGQNEVIVEVPTYDKLLLGILGSMGMQGVFSYYPGTTVRIINPDSLWNEVFPLIEELRDEETLLFSVDDLPEGVTQDMEELVRFLFDGFNRCQYGHPWDGVFPLPMPWPNGLNYI